MVGRLSWRPPLEASRQRLGPGRVLHRHYSDTPALLALVSPGPLALGRRVGADGAVPAVGPAGRQPLTRAEAAAAGPAFGRRAAHGAARRPPVRLVVFPVPAAD